MAKSTVSEWDVVADNNTRINGVNIDENCPPSAINNAIREVMAQVKQWKDGYTDSVTGNKVYQSLTVDDIDIKGVIKVNNTAGNDGQVIVSKGSLNSPVWENLNLGTMAYQDSNAVNITGGSVKTTGDLNVTGGLKLDNNLGTNGQVLTSKGSSGTPQWSSVSIPNSYTKAESDATNEAQNTKINANTAKVSNATHTGDVTGSTTLTIGTGKVTEAKLASNSVTASKIASNAVGASEIATNAVGNAEVATNAIKASELYVSGNGNTSQYLRADGDGTFTWATPSGTGASTSYNGTKTYSLYSTSGAKNVNTTVSGIKTGTSNQNSLSGTWRIMGAVFNYDTGTTIGSTTYYLYLIVRIS